MQLCRWRSVTSQRIGLRARRTNRYTILPVMLSVGVLLGSCSPFAGFVSDHWPHWAGGMPDDVPPRPGTPGYDDFIAHGQAAKNAAAATPADDRTNAAAAPSQAAPVPAASAQQVSRQPAPVPPG